VEVPRTEVLKKAFLEETSGFLSRRTRGASFEFFLPFSDTEEASTTEFSLAACCVVSPWKIRVKVSKHVEARDKNTTTRRKLRVP
jgi:hypothetical protein